MATGDGRNSVVTKSVIGTQWGNAVADRTVQTYANASDRDSQFKTPQDGAVCYTQNDDDFWFRTSGKWVTFPRGLTVAVDGPAKIITLPAPPGYVNVLTAAFPARVGHHYLVTCSAGVTVDSQPGVVQIRALDDMGGAYQMVDTSPDLIAPHVVNPNNPRLNCSTTWIYRPTQTSTGNIYVQMNIYGTPGCVLRILPNWVHIAVVDVGG